MHMGVPGLVQLQAPSYSPNVIQSQGPIMSGIDPRYLAAFTDNSSGYIASDTSKKQTEIDLLKNEVQYQVKTRGEKLKELYINGTRVYSGSVENILKWHKSLQDIGVMVLYEIVGKCVSVRAGESCAKNLVVRDDNGPAIQVVYYEIDFLLPELKIPCMIRAIGRIMPGTSRLQAFNVRPATGDDVASLPRRAAVASHHITKLCKEYFN
ncbi:uncharacterized protein LOC125068337 [Vanessa atalanta]|uniref:uncharacterized protein LOC125068337 n=1 Tax=Vanessa atalanta TaxID=42275 RepID=UPI001FCD380C|nr:uncharacterized protein LOC125068337 [Vanessa atalanta]